jgi:general secretion pathway protein D
MLAGLINDEEHESGSRLPGLGNLPVLGRLFGNQRDARNKTEIVLLITPHIVRAAARPDVLEPMLPAGTEAEVGAAPLRIKLNASRSLSLSSKGPAGAEEVAEPAASEEAPAAVTPADIAQRRKILQRPE